MNIQLLVLAMTLGLLPTVVAAGDKSFDHFLKEYSTTIFPEKRDSLLQDFWQTALRRGIPYIEENKTEVTFLYRGKDSVTVFGDFTSWMFHIPLRNLPESDLWYLKLSFEPDARLDYKFVVGRGREVLDPQNSKVVPSGHGDHSELAMPDFIPATELEEQKNVRKGDLTTLTVPSKILGYDHTVFVYLPPGYDGSKLSYPVAYFQDGTDYINFAKARTILDNLLSTNVISPVIGVFVVPPSEPKRNRITEYGMSKSYDKFFTTELIPFIDKKYRTEQAPSSRLIVGVSYGGLISLYIAFNNPTLVSNVASQSGFVSFKNDTLAGLFQQALTEPLRVYLGVGLYEKNIGSAPRPQRESDFLAANRRFSKVLEQKQYQFRYREFHDGHSWSRWRTELPNILRWFFPPR